MDCLLKGTVRNSSASGHRFTVDETSVHWSHQNEDQRPQFKSDHQEPAAPAADEPIELRPPPTSIYQTDDQLNHEKQQIDDTVVHDQVQEENDDPDDGGEKVVFTETTDTAEESTVNSPADNENDVVVDTSWQVKQHHSTQTPSKLDQRDIPEYKRLTCRLTYNLYSRILSNSRTLS